MSSSTTRYVVLTRLYIQHADCLQQEFTDEFKRRTQSLTKGKCQYGLIEHDHWNQPDW